MHRIGVDARLTRWLLHISWNLLFLAVPAILLLAVCADGVTPGRIRASGLGGWRTMRSGSTAQLNGVACPSGSTCVAVGNGGAILTSGDGGATWNRRESITSANLMDIACPTSRTCIAVGTGGTTLTSSDGGATWIGRTAVISDMLYGIACPTQSTCIAVGYGGSVQTSGDGGTTWRSRDTNTMISLSGISCLTSSTCLAVTAEGGIYTTRDGGQSWQGSDSGRDFGSGTNNGLDSVSCPTTSTCLAVGEKGTIVITGDGGHTLQRVFDDTSDELHAVACPGVNTCVAAGDRGTIVVTVDGGDSWQSVSSGIGTPLNGVGCPSSSTCLAVGQNGTIVAGTLFSTIPTPAPTPSLSPERSATPPAPSQAGQCAGPHDLLVTGRVVLLSGLHSYDHVCIGAAGVLQAGDSLLLRAAYIWIDSHGRLSGDGAPGDSMYGYGGAFITLIARHALIAGVVSSRGGAGESDATAGDPNEDDGGSGGDGGTIVVKALDLRLTGSLVVTGGAGGGGSTTGGSGGLGGVAVVLAPGLSVRSLAGHVSVDGGPGGQGDTAGEDGGAGVVRVGTLSQQDLALIPPELTTSTAQPKLPTDGVPSPAAGTPGVTYVAATHHTIGGPFLSFYNSYGALRIFGLPLTEAYFEHGATVQFLERAEIVLGSGGIHLADLGTTLTAGRHFAPVATVATSSTRRYFPATHHLLSGRFLQFWQTHHGSLIYGMPISATLMEQNGDGTGRSYLVQYFQNGRLEYHPELSGTSYEVTPGQVGR